MDEAKKEMILSYVSFTTDIHDAADADVVIEAIPENYDAKVNLFTTLDEICKPETIFGTNTGTLTVTGLAATTKRPDKFIGTHFFNPATAMKLVELIRAATTSDETFNTVFDLCKRVNKQPVAVNDAPGFIVNKMFQPMINEAIYLVESGVATPEDIDTAMKLGCNHPMGPLELADMVGLDVCLAVMDALYEETHDPKYRATLLTRKMVRAGHLGRKTGKGFYDYT